MESPSVELPDQNYVGLLQEKCGKHKTNLPEYREEVLDTKLFKCSCKVKDWCVEAIGFSKKIAKQNAAKAMYNKIESEKLLNDSEGKGDPTKHCAVSKIIEYCVREKKSKALFSEMPEEDELFVMSCTLDGFTGIGKGTTKKIAKEKSADLVAKQFNIYKYFDDLKKSEVRKREFKNPCQQLHEFCQLKKLHFSYKEENVPGKKKTQHYVSICTVGTLESKSVPNCSKKQAKMEAAKLMLNLLTSSTPGSSPAIPTETISLSEYNTSPSSNEEFPEEYCSSDASNEELLEEYCSSDDDEPLTKRIKA